MAFERPPIMTVVAPPDRYDRENEAQFRRQIEQWALAIAGALERFQESVPVGSDATRGDPGIPGRVIFNLDDDNLNIDNGTNWILPNDTIT